jgi:ligand-binding sensor domain-containing protein/heat shock protein HslJ
MLAAVALAALLTACGGFGQTMEPSTQPVVLDSTEWVLTSLNGSRPVEGSNITLSFAGGRAGGFAGCNGYGSEYAATDKGTLTIAEPEITLQLCQTPAGVMEQEGAYIEALREAAVYRATDGYLEIGDASGEISLVFARQEELPMDPSDLLGTEWKLLSWSDSSPIAESVITLVFRNEAEIDGEAGCRGYRGTYEASGDDIRFPFLEMTGSSEHCPDTLLVQEGEYTTSLERATNYRLEEGQLEILTARGEVLVFELLAPFPLHASPPAPTPTPASAQARPAVPTAQPLSTASFPEASSDVNWVGYPSLNDIRSLAFAADGSLWAGTGSGVVRWDLATGAHVRYGTANGLASDDVTDLTFAPDGGLWAATRGGGVSHFDGTNWTTFTETDGLINNIVYAIDAAPDGSVWVGTDSGVSHFDGAAWTSYTTADGLASEVVWYVAVAPDGDVWFSSHAGGVSQYDPDRNAWSTHGAEQGLPLPNARFLTIGPDGAPWLHIGYDHVYRFDGATWQLAYEAGGGQWVCDIAFDADGSPWIATCGGYHTYGAGLAHMDGAAWAYVTAADGLIEDNISAVAVGAGSGIAAGTDRGISVYQAGRWRTLRSGPALKQVTGVAVTPDGAAWFGFGNDASRAAGGGLSRFDGHDWQYVLDDGNVRALAVAPDGALWAGVGCEVWRFDAVAWELVARCEDLPHGNVLDIAFTAGGNVWIATGHGLGRFDGQSWTPYDRLAHSLDVAPNGAIWLNGWEGLQGSQYVARFDGERWTTYEGADSYPGGFTVSAVTSDGSLWGVVPERRLARFDGQSWADSHSWTFYSTAEGLPSDQIVDLLVAPDDVLWAITDGGIAHFNGRAWEGILLDRDLGRVNIMAFAPDDSVWLGTSIGAVHLQP